MRLAEQRRRRAPGGAAHVGAAVSLRQGRARVCQVLLDLRPELGRPDRGGTIRGLRRRGDEGDVAVQRHQIEVQQRADKLRLADDPVAQGRIHRDRRHACDDLIGPEDGLVVMLPQIVVHLEVVAREGELGEVREIGPRAIDQPYVRAEVAGEHQPAAVRAVVLQAIVDGVHTRHGVRRGAPERVGAGLVGVGQIQIRAPQERRTGEQGREKSPESHGRTPVEITAENRSRR